MICDLSKLLQKGLQVIPENASILENRKGRVKINTIHIDIEIIFGAPQGSIVALILFDSFHANAPFLYLVKRRNSHQRCL